MKKEEKSRIIALRVPNKTYDILLQRSNDWQMSVSFLIRELVIRVFNEQEIDTIKAYRKRKEKSKWAK